MLSKKDKEYLVEQKQDIIEYFKEYNIELKNLDKIKEERDFNLKLLDNLRYKFKCDVKTQYNDKDGEFISLKVYNEFKIPIDIANGEIFVTDFFKNLFKSDIIDIKEIEKISNLFKKIKNHTI